MEPSTQHKDLINPLSNPTAAFHNFSRLPIEVRWLIWEQVLCHERLLRIHLLSPWEDPKNTHVRSPPLSRIIPKDYVILVKQPTLSRLFRVCAESRSSALCFYRVRLPCRYFEGDQQVHDGTLYIKPELDTFDIRGTYHFVKFARDLWNHDPRNLGLLNLAIAQTWLFDMHRLTIWESDTTSLQQVLSRLKHVMFIQDIVRDQFLPESYRSFNGFFALESRRRDPWVPMMGVNPIFSRQSDPRGIGKNLERLYIGDGNCYRVAHSWLSLLAALRIECVCDYRFAITSTGWQGESGIRRRNDALRLSDHKSIQRGRHSEILREPQLEKNSTQPLESIQEVNNAPRTAVGFWVFPIESLGSLPPLNPDPSRRWRLPWSAGTYCGYIDLTKYRPEICLSDLW